MVSRPKWEVLRKDYGEAGAREGLEVIVSPGGATDQNDACGPVGVSTTKWTPDESTNEWNCDDEHYGQLTILVAKDANITRDITYFVEVYVIRVNQTFR